MFNVRHVVRQPRHVLQFNLGYHFLTGAIQLYSVIVEVGKELSCRDFIQL